MNKARAALVIGACLLACMFAQADAPRTSLQLSWGQKGLEKVEYRGIVLTDTSVHPGDAFHIGHIRVTDLQGKVLTGPADGWGENGTSKAWDSAKRTWTYEFAWGTLQTTYAQTADNLTVTVTETNRPNSGVILAGAVVYPLTLHFPSVPLAFAPRTPQIETNTTGPAIVQAKFGSTQIVSVATGHKPLYSGLWPTNDSSTAYSLLIGSTTPDHLAAFLPHFDRPVRPGGSDTFTVSLRFASANIPLRSIAADVYRSRKQEIPAALTWPDRRIIGTAFLANAPISGQAGTVEPSNPRRYFVTDRDPGIDIRTPQGLSKFQTLVLQKASQIIVNLRRLDAQGVITWDLEGQQFPHDTSYVCSPDKVGTTAPEMESIVKDPRSPYVGLKLDDAYFKTITSAGFRAGLCIRPQLFEQNTNGHAEQMQLSARDAEATMLKKMRYAHDRWGITLFYIDSNVEQNGATFAADTFRRLAAALPDSLLIPEQSTPDYYSSTAPFKTFLFHRDLGTGDSIRFLYEHAFSCNLINDVDPAALKASIRPLTQAVIHGDILMGHADYWHQNNGTLIEIYASARTTRH